VSRREVLRLRDIRDAIATIRGHIESGSFDRKTSDAVLDSRDFAPITRGRGEPAGGQALLTPTKPQKAVAAGGQPGPRCA